MGTWGAGVFSDDLACEVRDLYRDLLAEGYSAEEARDAVLQSWIEFLNDVDAGPVIWLALAVTQWKLGRLDEQTRARALAVIESGEALNAWREDERGFRQREAVLLKVHQQLCSPQPPRRRLRKRFKGECDWEKGELISYRTRTGRIVVFRVIGHHTDRGGTSPIVELLDLVGERLPSASDLEKSPVRRGKVVDAVGPIPARPITQFLIGRLSEKELPTDRIERLGVKSTPIQEVGGFAGASWKTLDALLLDIFGLE